MRVVGPKHRQVLDCASPLALLERGATPDGCESAKGLRTSHASPIPKGLCPPAQGCEERATLGNGKEGVGNPNGVGALWHVEHRHNPVGVGNVRTVFSQGCSSLATLGFESESLWDSPCLLPV